MRARVLAPLLLLVAGVALVPAARAEIVPNPDPDLIAEWHPCEPGTGVTIIVDRRTLGDHMVYVRCALGPQPNGIVALQNAGFVLEGTVAWGLAFLCRIDGQPTPAEEDCVQTPGASSYWSYWHGKPGGRWSYSGAGAANPATAGGVDSVQGWGFAFKPRIGPMNGSGPSNFTLPPAQESSVIPAGLAREWLTDVTVRTAESALQAGTGVNPDKGEMLDLTIALGRAEAAPEELAPITNLLDGRESWGAFEYSSLELWANREGESLGIDPASPDFPLYGEPSRYAQAILGIEALGEDPTDFAGVDFRAALTAKIDAATGALRMKDSDGETLSNGLGDLALTVQALARMGTLPPPALKTIDLIEDQQEVDGSLGSSTASTAMAIEAMVAARDAGAGSPDLEAAISQAGAFLESVQAVDGGVRKAASGEPLYDPNLSSTAAGAVGLGLSGRPEAAERAAKWVSRHQVTAEYAGTPDPSTGEPAPAEALIGAFAANKDELYEMLTFGLNGGIVGSHGFYPAVRVPTAQALRALIAAGPYGPFYAHLDQGTLHFANQTVGSQSAAQAVTLANRDVRPISIEGATLIGPQGSDFLLDAEECVGETLDPGDGCELSARFVPGDDGIRDAVARLELAGTDQAVELALSGTAVPLITHTLAATTTGAGAISAQTGAIQGCATNPPAGTCAGAYQQGSTVTLTAAPALHHKLTGWSVGGAAATTCAGATSPCTVTIGAADVSIVASFAPITRTLSVATVGSGRVSANVGAIKQCATAPANGTCSGSYEEGTMVTFSATAAAGHRFTGWSGGGCSGTGGCSIDVEADTMVEATFEQLPPSSGDPGPAGGAAQPRGPLPSLSKNPGSISSVEGAQAVGERRIAKVGVVSCPALALTCTVKSRRQVRVKIAGRWYMVRVLPLQPLAGGESAPLRIRLPRSAVKMLGSNGATVRVKVWLFADSATPISQLVEAQIEAEA